MSLEQLNELEIDASGLLSALDHHAIVSITDRRGTIVYANDKFCEVSGYQRHELLGQNHRLINSNFHPPEFFQGMWRTIAAGERWSGIIRNRTKSRDFYWVQTTITPLKDERGAVTHFIAIRTEITETKRNEEILDRNSHFLALLNENAKDLINRKPEHIDEELGRILGRWCEVVLADHGLLLDITPQTRQIRVASQYPVSLPELAEDIEQINADNVEYGPTNAQRTSLITDSHHGRIHSHEKVVATIEKWGYHAIISVPVLSNGQVRYVLKFLARNRDGFESLAHQMFCLDVLSDLLTSVYLRFENERLLLQQKQKLDARQHLAHLGDWDMDVASLVVTWSPGLFGLSNKQAELPLRDFVELVHPDDRKNFLARINAGVNHFEPANFEFRLISPGPNDLWVQLRGARMRSREQRTDTFIATLINISHAKAIENQLVEARLLAERASTAKSQFLSNMSHELRTPLNSILGFGQLLQMDPVVSEHQKDSVLEILRAGKHLLNLINDILDLSVLESGAMNIVLERIPLRTIVEETLALMRPMIKTRRLTLEVKEIPDSFVLADRTKFKQALINLLSNAIKYNRSRGKITVDCRIDQNHGIHVAVIDTGHGIDAKSFGDLFKPFSRLGLENSGIEGTGIGLNYTKTVVELMGGTIGCTSSKNEGSTFTISLFGVPHAAPDGGRRPFRSDKPEHKCRVLYLTRDTNKEDNVYGTLRQEKHLTVERATFNLDHKDLTGRFEPGLLVFDLGDLRDPTLDDTYLDTLARTFGNPPIIALVDAGKIRDLKAWHLRHSQRICLKPVDGSALHAAIQSLMEGVGFEWI